MLSVCLHFDEYQKESYIFTSNDSGFIKIWGMDGQFIKNINKTENNETYFLDTYYDETELKYFLISGEMKCVKSFELNTHQLFRTYIDNNSFAEHLSAFVYKNMGVVELVECEFYGYIRIWNFHSGNLIKKIEISDNEKKKTISLKIWDTAGQERFRSVATQYIKSCDGLLIVYAINDRKSFEKIDDWLKEVEEKKNTNYNVPLVLIGNKIDLEKEREVSFQEGEKLAQIYNMEFFECSAKDNINVNECFNCLIELIFQLYEDEFNIDDKSYSLFDNGTMNTSNCCLKKKK
jgi:small GTP-binding protein